MKITPRHLGSFGGVLLILQAFVLLLGQLHMVLVEHVVCVEHGEIVHADEHGDSGDAESHDGDGHDVAAEELRADTDARPAVQRGDAPDEHEHESCGDVLRAEPAPDTESGVWYACSGHLTVASIILEPAAWELVPRADTQTYLFAPKTSPPRV